MYDKVLIPVDGSEVSNHAAKEGFRLADALGSEVILLYVIDTSIVTLPEPESGIPNVDVVRQTLAAEGKKIMDELTGQAKAGGLKLETVIGEGDVPDEIVKTADDRGVGLIILGTHGRSGLRRLLIGSAAEAVTRRAHCPVLLIRPQGDM